MKFNANEKVQSQVYEVLNRFKYLVSTKNLKVVAEFAPDDNVLLVGSDDGEVARGKQEIEDFFVRIFAQDTTFSWEWDRIDISHAGGIAWFFAEGRVVLSTEKDRRKSSYRISGVLERSGDQWLWRQYHGSEPVIRE